MCLLDLAYNLPVQVRDSAMTEEGAELAALPGSDVGKEYALQRMAEDGTLGAAFSKQQANDTILRLQRTGPYYKVRRRVPRSGRRADQAVGAAERGAARAARGTGTLHCDAHRGGGQAGRERWRGLGSRGPAYALPRLRNGASEGALPLCGSCRGVGRPPSVLCEVIGEPIK